MIYRSKIHASQRREISCSKDSYELIFQNWNPDTVEYVEEFKVLVRRPYASTTIIKKESFNNRKLENADHSSGSEIKETGKIKKLAHDE